MAIVPMRRDNTSRNDRKTVLFMVLSPFSRVEKIEIISEHLIIPQGLL
jgi:hypothetical protein